MAFLRRKRRFSVIIAFLILTLLCVMSAGLYYLYQTRLAKIVKEYEEKIEEINLELYALKRQVFVPKQDIPFGTVLTRDMFDTVDMKLDIPQKVLFDESDIGKINTVLLPSGIPVLKMLVTDEKLADDLRELEFNMFMIQTNQMKGDYIDVRILFPNGENYIVLSKKQIKEIMPEENTVRLWLNETEIHNISSAIIDAYIHPGTKIYVVKYVMPELQGAAIPFYVPNEDVLDLMLRDPNVLEKASDALAQELRESLERNLNSITDDNIGKVTTGVTEEFSKNREVIQSQESVFEKTDDENTANQNVIMEDIELFN